MGTKEGDTHTITITLVRNKQDDERAAAERFPGMPIETAMKHLLMNEVTSCIKAGRLTGTLTGIVGSSIAQ